MQLHSAFTVVVICARKYIVPWTELGVCRQTAAQRQQPHVPYVVVALSRGRAALGLLSMERWLADEIKRVCPTYTYRLMSLTNDALRHSSALVVIVARGCGQMLLLNLVVRGFRKVN